MYNKLVRDKIPSVIEANGEKPLIRILSDEEYLIELNKKLKEEVIEYLSDDSIYELADVMEVILAILDSKGATLADFEKIRKDKVLRRGAFKEKIFLEGVEKWK